MAKETVHFAQKAIIIKNNKVLLIKKSEKDELNPNRYEFPGGRLSYGEDLDAHIKNKVRGEVGLEVEPGELFDMWQFKIDTKELNIMVVAVARFCEVVSGEVSALEEDIAGYEWVSIDDDLLKLDLIPGVRKTMEKLVSLYKKTKTSR